MSALYRLPWQKGLVELRQRLLTTIYPPICLICGADGQLINGEGLDICKPCHSDLQSNERCCPRCGIPLNVSAEICGACLKKPPPFETFFAPYLYQGDIQQLLIALKFNHKLSHARLLGTLMAEKLADHFGLNHATPDAIIPVPLHSKRQRERGYNQAMELVRSLAKYYKIPINHQLVSRKTATAKQTKLSADERRRNLKGAFVVRDLPEIPPHIVIFDDVVTTGATVTELAKSLKRAGAQRVDVWAVARVPKPGD